MTDKLVFKSHRIPRGSRMERYLKGLPRAIKREADEFLSYLHDVFRECLQFLEQSKYITYRPTLTLIFVPTREEFKEIEQRESERTISKEVAKAPVSAFVVGNRFRAIIYIDLIHFLDLLKFGYPTFILNLVQTFIHEILHTAFPHRYEQDIYDLTCNSVEGFLGIKLPKKVKKLKASDYYSKQTIRDLSSKKDFH